MTFSNRPAVPITGQIWDRAVELQREREARRPDDAGVRQCAERLYELAGERDVLEYLRQRVEEMDLTSPPAGSTLWAWRSQHPTSGEFVGNRYLAHAWAEAVIRTTPEDPVTVIHLTPGGSEMDLHWLNDRRTLAALDLDPDDVKAIWQRLSERYAEHISGETLVFSDMGHSQAVLHTTELPVVRRSPEAGLDKIRFVHPPAPHLPEAVRHLLYPDAIRARVQIDDPNRPHYLDTAALLKLSPPKRATYIKQVLEQVDLDDRKSARHQSATAGPPTPAPRGPSAAPGAEAARRAALAFPANTARAVHGGNPGKPPSQRSPSQQSHRADRGHSR
ncbi:hypothetical protein ACGGAQ_05705 [Micromonospora sp. NPDC047557]|uniref:hypothetical protein n=1 Tax=Micromonospora sp. NPDC047557 TaxID=3364250 RepID=UPI003723254E